MSRVVRQDAILAIVCNKAIHSQARLVEELAAVGIDATQATVSRDLRQLGALKAPDSEGGGRYLLAQQLTEVHGDHRGELRRAFQRAVTGVGGGNVMIVVRTLAGHANAVATAIDDSRLPEVEGTIAGNDTIFIALRSQRAAQALRQRLGQWLD